MSLNKEQNIIKYFVITSATPIVLVAVNTISIPQKSTKNANNINIELKNLSSNLQSLKNEIKNIWIDLIPPKKQSQRWNECFNNTSLMVLQNGEKSCGIG